MKKSSLSSVVLGAAFLMATSAIGPGFLTQTAQFTATLAASFGFVILLSVILDIFAQLNIWRVLTISGKRAQDVANESISGSGYILAALIVFGGLAFNIGNIAGAGLGLNVLFGLKVEYGAIISAIIGISIFLTKDAGKMLDLFTKLLGFVMLGLILYVVFASRPPLGEAVFRTFYPKEINALMIVTLVGGTVGGYITFAGAHRLIDAGITGKECQREVTKSATTGILLTAVIRFLLFLAAFGVLKLGYSIGSSNPPASVFRSAAGNLGYSLFGIVMWAAAITSVIGSAYTSVSFIKTFHARFDRSSNHLVVGFISVSTVFFLFDPKPVKLLILAGTINGFILPVGLALILVASRKSEIVGDYRHPAWMQVTGWLVVLIMVGFSIQTLLDRFT